MSKGLVDAFIGIAKSVETRLSAKLEQLSVKVAELEQRRIEAVAGPPGEKGEPGAPGKDAPEPDLDLIVEKAVARIPVPKDGAPGPKGDPGLPGKDAPEPDLDEIALRSASLIPVPKDGAPGPKGDPGEPGKDAPEPDLSLIAQKAAALIPVPKDGKDGRDGQDVPETVVKALVEASVKAAVEAIPTPRDGRDGLPGQPGEKGLDGKDGRDGIDGKDGADGLGFDDWDVEYDGERSFTFKFVQGDREKSFGPFKVPVQIYRGVFQAGKSYERGDSVTWGGSQWVAMADTTSKPGESSVESRAWQLAVKRGSDGKAGPPGPKGEFVTVKA